MTEFSKHAIRGAAGTLHDALNESAYDLETKAPISGHSHRMTLLILAGTCFLLGFLWAKARAQSF
jgi:hypothetical protein